MTLLFITYFLVLLALLLLLLLHNRSPHSEHLKIKVLQQQHLVATRTRWLYSLIWFYIVISLSACVFLLLLVSLGRWYRCFCFLLYKRWYCVICSNTLLFSARTIFFCYWLRPKHAWRENDAFRSEIRSSLQRLRLFSLITVIHDDGWCHGNADVSRVQWCQLSTTHSPLLLSVSL